MTSCWMPKPVAAARVSNVVSIRSATPALVPPVSPARCNADYTCAKSQGLDRTKPDPAGGRVRSRRGPYAKHAAHATRPARPHWQVAEPSRAGSADLRPLRPAPARPAAQGGAHKRAHCLRAAYAQAQCTPALGCTIGSNRRRACCRFVGHEGHGACRSRGSGRLLGDAEHAAY